MNDDLNIDALKEEATDLGIKFNPNIGAEKLQSKIEEFYASQETSGKELIEAVVANEKAEEKSAETNNDLQKVMSAVDAIKAFSVQSTTPVLNYLSTLNSTLRAVNTLGKGSLAALR